MVCALFNTEQWHWLIIYKCCAAGRTMWSYNYPPGFIPNSLRSASRTDTSTVGCTPLRSLLIFLGASVDLMGIREPEKFWIHGAFKVLWCCQTSKLLEGEGNNPCIDFMTIIASFYFVKYIIIYYTEKRIIKFKALIYLLLLVDVSSLSAIFFR